LLAKQYVCGRPALGARVATGLFVRTTGPRTARGVFGAIFAAIAIIL